MSTAEVPTDYGQLKAEILDELFDAVASLPELREAYTSADIALRAEDFGYVRLGAGTMAGETDTATRQREVQLARIYHKREPLAKQAVRLWTDYAIGSGLNFKSPNAGHQAALELFWGDPLNRSIFSAQGIRKSSHRVLVDGECFLALIGDAPQIVVRRIDSLEITAMLCDPDDYERVIFYKREYTTAVNSELKTEYYRAWDVELGDLPEVYDNGKVINDLAKPGVVMYPVLLDPFGNRGNSLLGCVVDWLREHRRFMESRVSITQALAKFAWKFKAEGGTASQLTAIKNKVLAGVPASAAQGGGQQMPQAATWIGNQSADLTAMPRDTGAANARDDSDLFKLQVCAGTGIFLHYFGDPSTGNLATTTAMELPQLKQFQAYQQLWTDTYRNIFNYVLGTHDTEIDIDWPPIIEADIAKIMSAVSAAIISIPALADLPELWMQILQALGINDVNPVIEKIKAAMAERKAEAKVVAATPDVPDKSVLDAVDALREALYP